MEDMPCISLQVSAPMATKTDKLSVISQPRFKIQHLKTRKSHEFMALYYCSISKNNIREFKYRGGKDPF